MKSLRAVLMVMLAALGLVGTGGCAAALNANRVELRALHEQGRYADAGRVLDDPKTKDLYESNSKLLYWLDRGAVALAEDNPARAVELLEKAEGFMEVKREPTAGEEFGRWLVNDTVTEYYGEPYEDVYVNVLKLLAQLEAGQISGGATVEARRMAGKADVLRDRYVRTRKKVEQVRQERVRSGGSASSASEAPQASRYVDVNSEGDFLESTLGAYLTAVTFMKDGDTSNQSVAGRRLLSALELQKDLQRGVNQADFAGLGDTPASSVNVLVVALSGRAPHKEANKIGPIPLYEWPVYFELPVLVGGSSEVGSARAVFERVDGGGGGGGGGAKAVSLSKVEDMRAVATENHRRQLPQIYARTLVRSQIKAAAAFAATQGVKNSQRRGNDRDLAQVGMILAGLAFVTATESADLRCWTFLPGRADVATAKLEPGRYRVRVEYLSRSGGVTFVSPPREIVVGSGDAALTSVVEHYWR